jgi:hypothetical protein
MPRLQQHIALLESLLEDTLRVAEALDGLAATGDDDFDGVARALIERARVVHGTLEVERARLRTGVAGAEETEDGESACDRVLATLHGPLLALRAQTQAAGLLLASRAPITPAAIAACAQVLRQIASRR